MYDFEKPGIHLITKISLKSNKNPLEIEYQQKGQKRYTKLIATGNVPITKDIYVYYAFVESFS